MTASELIAELQKVAPNSRVWMGYDSNMVVTEPQLVISPNDREIAQCWWSTKSGDTVILCKR